VERIRIVVNPDGSLLEPAPVCGLGDKSARDNIAGMVFHAMQSEIPPRLVSPGGVVWLLPRHVSVLSQIAKLMNFQNFYNSAGVLPGHLLMGGHKKG
jgi:hypothetical protein